MMMHVENPWNDSMISRLNDKISSYNALPEHARYPQLVVQKALLLEEIHFMANSLKDAAIDNQLVAHTIRGLTGLRKFRGVNLEIERYSGIPAGAHNAKILLIQLSKSGDNIENVLRSTQKSSIARRKKSGPFKEVLDALETLCSQQQNNDGSPQKQEEYYYNLLKFKNLLLHKLSFEITDPKCEKYCRKMLGSVNNELNTSIPRIPRLREEYTKQIQGEETLTHLSSRIESLTLQELMQASRLLRIKFSDKDTIAALKQLLLPNPPHLQLTYLGGSNNVNWKITDELNGCEYLLRFAEPQSNQGVLRQISAGPLQTSLAKEYLSTMPDVELYPYSISILEFLPDGDLYKQRQNIGDPPDPNELMLQVSRHISELVQIGQHLLDQNCVHTDIKLTNFLTRDGKVIMSDTKGILSCNEDNRFRQCKVITGIYAPPEISNRTPEGFSAEAFMCYQIGLALYDYLVQPAIQFEPSNPPPLQWSEKRPLDFSHACFSSPQGQAMQTLISRMTDLNAANRISLSEAKVSLDNIQALVEQLVATAVIHTTVQPAAQIAKASALDITRDRRASLRFFTERKNDIVPEAAQDKKEQDAENPQTPRV